MTERIIKQKTKLIIRVKQPCGNTGCLELYASIPEIVTQARNSVSPGMDSALGGYSMIEWEDIVEQAFAGDRLRGNCT